MRFTPSPSFSPFLITSPFLFSPQILNFSLFPLPRLLPLLLHVYLWCCSLWLSLPAVDERVDWLEVVSGVRSGGLALSRPVSLCLSSLQSSRQDETAPPRFAHRRRGPTDTVAHQDPHTPSFSLRRCSKTEKSGIEVERGDEEWTESDSERGRRRNRKQAL